ncbi:uncharacterized protein LAJ45_06159 [Morchella importuna]|uniref:uncharacterized protein n=1 Tax=Morchella importuna TaxID=1174673 RepID=UPI001E8CE1E9|nr:uncharacterized protein LAJ45_06159 [Morchella importuna]KAH8150006.1 hypothetical protein LAJ45_06159 [Morchella importuna]
MDVGNDGLISLKDEIADLESRLNKARTNLIAASNKPDSSPSGTQASTIHAWTAASTLPFVIAAYKTPIDSPILDDIFDASTTCSVARRASISQGRALLSVFEKSFSTSLPTSPPDMEAFETYRQSLRSKISEERANGHFGVSWGLGRIKAKLC